MRFPTFTRSRCLGLAALAASAALPLLCPGQFANTHSANRLLAESTRIGDPTVALPDLWMRSNSRLGLSAHGYVVFQNGHRLRSLDKSSFDPAIPFCVIDVESAATSDAPPDPQMAAGEERPASVVPPRENPADLGPFHLLTDLLLVSAQGSPWTIQFGFMWPRGAGSAPTARRSITVADLHAIVGPEFAFGTGKIASPPGTIRVDTFNLGFEVLVLDDTRTNARKDIKDGQFTVYEGCTPTQPGSCNPVAHLEVERADTTGGGVNFMVVAEIGSQASQGAMVRDAVARLADFTKPQDRLAIIPYHQRPIIWQRLTGDTDRYRARAASLLNADVGARDGYINTRAAVAMALTDVAGKAEPASGNNAQFPQRNVILLATQGYDCFNAYELAKMAAEHNTSIWVLDLTGMNRGELRPLAEMSGGFYFRVDGYEDLLAHMQQFIEMWHRVYLLSYHASPPDNEGRQPRREIRVTRAGGSDLEKVSLIVSKGFHGPQVVANMVDLEETYVEKRPFGDAQNMSELLSFLHEIDEDSDFPGYVLKGILLAQEPAEFFGFLDRIDHMLTPKRRKTIGHLITANLEVFRAMKPKADDWMKLRSKIGNAEDWKQVTEAFLPELNSADLLLRALKIDETGGDPQFAEELGALAPGMALGQARRFGSLMRTDSQRDAFLALLPDEYQKIQARRAFGMPLERAAPDISRIFQDTSDPTRSVLFLQGLLCSASNPAEFGDVLTLYRKAGKPNYQMVASDAVLACLKNLASFSAPQTTIPMALGIVQGCGGRLAAVRELKGTITQINQLKEESGVESCLPSLYLLAVRQARTAEELAAALSIPQRAGGGDPETLRDEVIDALLLEFQRDGRPADQYFVLGNKARAAALKIAVWQAGLLAPGVATVKQQLTSGLNRLGAPVK
jgi:hypothetical protein